MNSVILLLVAIGIFVVAYLVYGRWLAKSWGVDPKAKTPAYEFEDGEDFEPTPWYIVFSHQFSSIAGAGPVTGPIIASMFGWVPVFLWIIVGGIFFGAVHDFAAMYASVKNEGKSLGLIIEKYIGKIGRKLFTIFCWLFTILVIAAFADMVAGTFNGFMPDPNNAANVVQSLPNAAAGSISMLFMVAAVVLGFVIKFIKPNQLVQTVIALVLLVGTIALGIAFPMYFSKMNWLYIVFAYLFVASVTPMWALMQPRDFLTTFMLLGMIIGAVAGVLVTRPTMNLNAFNGFVLNTSTIVNGQEVITQNMLFPTLFVTIACGAVSGFHSLVSSGTSSKQVDSEKNILPVGFGAMLVECVLSIVALIVVGAVAVDGFKPDGTPFQIFSSSVAGFLTNFGMDQVVAQCFMTMCVSALALTSLDSVARIGRMSFQEMFVNVEDPSKNNPILTNKYFATVVTLAGGFALSLGGYNNIWILFGSANQLLAALSLMAVSVFLRITGRKGVMLWVPMGAMLACTFTALFNILIGIFNSFGNGTFQFGVQGLQLFFGLALLTLAVLIVYNSAKAFFGTKKETKASATAVAE